MPFKLIRVDNSEYSRNGDFLPSRFSAQKDAVTVIFNSKRSANPESSVGLATLAGSCPQVMVTLCQELGKVASALHKMELANTIQFSTGLSIAALALKHRLNKNQHQRIIVFVASPLSQEESEENLIKLAKKLKKNNVAVDVVNFGQEIENMQKLEAFIAAVNSNENSHLINVSAESGGLLSDVLLGSALFERGEGAAGSGGDFEFGIDPSLDPELAMALRMSLQEEQERQGRVNEGQSSAVPPSQSSPVAMDAEDEDAMLAQAIAMSMEQNNEDTEMSDANKK